jgi:hypothetical protein
VLLARAAQNIAPPLGEALTVDAYLMLQSADEIAPPLARILHESERWRQVSERVTKVNPWIALTLATLPLAASILSSHRDPSYRSQILKGMAGSTDATDSS